MGLETRAEDFYEDLVMAKGSRLLKVINEKFKIDVADEDVKDAIEDFYRSYMQEQIRKMGMIVSTKLFNITMTGFGIAAAYVASSKISGLITGKGRGVLSKIKTMLGMNRSNDKLQVAGLVMDGTKVVLDSNHFQDVAQANKSNNLSTQANMAMAKQTSILSNDHELKKAQILNESDKFVADYLTKSGSWQNTLQHRQIFKSIAGGNYDAFSASQWSQIIENLNKLSQDKYVKNGDIIEAGLAQLMQEDLIARGVTRL